MPFPKNRVESDGTRIANAVPRAAECWTARLRWVLPLLLRHHPDAIPTFTWWIFAQVLTTFDIEG
jgi:hypothetical protein